MFIIFTQDPHVTYLTVCYCTVPASLCSRASLLEYRSATTVFTASFDLLRETNQYNCSNFGARHGTQAKMPGWHVCPINNAIAHFR